MNPDYLSPVIPKNVEKPPDSLLNLRPENESETCCCHILQWIAQILLWVLIVIEVIVIKTSENKNTFWVYPPAAFFLMIYCLYVYRVLCLSPLSKYLRNKNIDDGLYQRMRTYFSTPPEVSFCCECYHKGETQFSDVVQIVTYSEQLKFPYYSGRDVSGLLYLNCNENDIENKKYLKLELSVEVNFADALSYMDYENAKNNFIQRNKNKDAKFCFLELKNIPGLKAYNLVKINESDSCLAHYGFLVIFTLLTFGEIYRLYFDSLCVSQKFKIRKLISTRHNITTLEYKDKYRQLNPRINILKQIYSYDENEYNYVNKDFKYNIPTVDELEKSEQFKDKIPKYEISTGNSYYKPGVIIDNSGYDNSILPLPYT